MSPKNSHTPGSAKKTAKNRVSEFGSKVLVVRSSKLFCKFCNVQIDFSRKSSISSHLNSRSHFNILQKSKIDY